MEHFSGNYIDVNSVILITNKLKLYLEKEEEIINNIIDELSILENYYVSDNDKVFNDKKNNLYYALQTSLNNKKDIIEFLHYTVNSYISVDERETLIFNNDIS